MTPRQASASPWPWPSWPRTPWREIAAGERRVQDARGRGVRGGADRDAVLQAGLSAPRATPGVVPRRPVGSSLPGRPAPYRQHPTTVRAGTGHRGSGGRRRKETPLCSCGAFAPGCPH
ncbi:hypothetical protein QJS66_20295 [Kocuria rhizophila]|nr:hypothetical protein QJS66_20295 [Kocuria rhizophila]